jgi:hypothetical protein
VTRRRPHWGNGPGVPNYLPPIHAPMYLAATRTTSSETFPDQKDRSIRQDANEAHGPRLTIASIRMLGDILYLPGALQTHCAHRSQMHLLTLLVPVVSGRPYHFRLSLSSNSPSRETPGFTISQTLHSVTAPCAVKLALALSARGMNQGPFNNCRETAKSILGKKAPGE